MQLERVQVRLGKTDAGTPLRRVRVVVVVCIVVRVCMRCRVRANPPTPPTPTCTHPQEGSSEGVHDDDDDDEDRRAPRRRLYYEEIDYPSEYSCSPGMEDDDEVTIEEGDEEGQEREQRSDITRHQSTEADEQPGRVPQARRPFPGTSASQVSEDADEYEGGSDRGDREEEAGKPVCEDPKSRKGSLNRRCSDGDGDDGSSDYEAGDAEPSSGNGPRVPPLFC
jgi:hypothetical protein